VNTLCNFILFFCFFFQINLLNGSPEILKVGTPVTLGPHNFMYKPLIEMRSKAKL